MADKFLNLTGLGYFKDKLDVEFASASDLSDLADEVSEIIAEGGEPNVIEIVKVNNSALTPDANKAVNIDLSGYAETGDIPTDLSDLTNTGNDPYAQISDIPTDLSDLTNTGNDPYATEGYVDQNGGKIDVIKVNGTTQTITNKEVDLTVPTKVSDLTNDGDGTTGSQFATKAYVDQNGGKIDVIKVNGTAQTITNKEVDITMPTDLDDLTNNGSDPYAQISDVESAVVGALKPKGSVAFASLPQLTAANLNSMYNVSDAFTTTADFVEGAGKAYPAGTNVAIINTGTDANPVYKYDAMIGVIDMSGYWATADLVAITTSEIDTLFA